MNVVIVESPAKAKTINKYLGPGYQVLASFGHIRDLPAKDGSVNPDDDFAMLWEVDGKSSKRMSEIASAVKSSNRLILATDPDREGEAISWHVLQVLRDKRAIKGQEIQRVVFNAITKQAVLEAMANPRAIDEPLVDAYLARRALDYLVGFNLSPVLWRKLPGARSAGRVQSVALRLICDRETEIEKFKPQEYWSIVAKLETGKQEAFDARLSVWAGKKVNRLSIGDGNTAGEAKAMLERAAFEVSSVESKPVKRNPYPPFTTSTLQQAANYALGFSAQKTMQVAQRLYEGTDIGGETVGLITYMRTDGVQIAPEAIGAVRKVIDREFGPAYVPKKPRFYSTKAKNAQEAHEAIRPTDLFRRPADVRRMLEPDQYKLYELIWMRTVASQMESAVLERTTVDILARDGGRSAELRAVGSVVKFDGFLRLLDEKRDDEDDEESRRLPILQTGDKPARKAIEATQHFTEPPPRYTEATLVKKMEELGIGRPSTYASTLAVLRDREYVRLDKRRLIPEDKGRLVIAFLESFFERYVEYGFTAGLEEQLDKISAGELSWKEVLRQFWEEFSRAVAGIKELRVAQVLDAINELLGDHIFPPRADGSDPRACPTCGNGKLSLKLGKFGSFIGCSNYPDCRYTRQLNSSGGEGDGGEGGEGNGDRVLGQDPDTGLDVTLKSGRFGPYVQLGDGDKPKRGSLPKGWDAATMTLERALKLINLPRTVGIHPETKKPIVANIGRFGPYLQHDGGYTNLPSVEDVFEVGENRAVTLIAEKAARGGRGRSAPAALANLGEHPTLSGPVTVRDGRYGAYVNHGDINATLPKGTDPKAVTLDVAIALIAERALAAPSKKAKAGAKAKSTKAAAKPAKAAKGDDGATGETKPTAKAKTGAAKAATTKAATKATTTKAATGKTAATKSKAAATTKATAPAKATKAKAAKDE
ncbi:MAG: type I DNA topoisomerase [Hyphomicrobiaceae bacterium]|nr:type I DNA topoisomerase [Hyphomicrobiaceae bacterium]